MLTDLNPTRSEIGRATSPWNYQFNLALHKSFRLGRVPINVYVYFQNLLNRKNVTNIFWRTGNADDDGFSALFPQKVIDENPDIFFLNQQINLRHRQNYVLVGGGDVFVRPREIRFGIQISLTAAEQLNR